MRSRTQGRIVSALGRVGFLCFALLACPLPLISSVATSGRIICREELSLNKREGLAAKLRVITGWPELKFDEGGILRLGSADADQGSQTARNLLRQAQAGPSVIILEDASNRQDVVFARVVPGRWKNHTSEMPPTFVVLIDFSDFDHLMGDRDALRSFDAGWGLLHEIDHVVNDSEDAETASDAGECEDHINLMRRECNLPLRTDYFFTYFPYAQQSDFKTRFVRLAFDQQDTAKAKQRRYWVVWDATLVGGLDRQQTASRR